MTERSSKRRKMRPNNAIAVQRAKSTVESRIPASSRGNRESFVRSRSILKSEFSETSLNQNDDVESYSSASDSDETDVEIERLTTTRVRKTTIDTKNSANVQVSAPSTKTIKHNSQRDRKLACNTTTDSTKKTQPNAQPMSASDSDESDKEKLSTPSSSSNASSDVKIITPQQSTVPGVSSDSDSDSDDTDTDQHVLKAKRKPSPKSRLQITAKSLIVEPSLSASDSDESDKEKLGTRLSNATNNEKIMKSQQQSQKVGMSFDSDFDSDDTDREQDASKKNSSLKNTIKPISDNSSSSASNSDTDMNRKRKQQSKKRDKQASSSDEADTDMNKKRKQHSKKHEQTSFDESSSSEEDVNNKRTGFRALANSRDHLVANRISFRRTYETDPTVPASKQYRKRLADEFVPNVNDEDFVSDSDSETDSGEDYDTREYPSWQRGLGNNRHADKDPWPKQRKFGYSDKLKLEKRIKKICKRENITFGEAKEIFSSSQRKEHVCFFQKIGKIFPEMSLHMLAKQCKEMYHIKRNNAPWTQEEIEKLDELKNTFGSNTNVLSRYLNRSPKNINDFLYSRKAATNKLNKQWTEEEDKLLASACAKIKPKKGGRMSFLSIEPLFKGERSQRQIYARYYLIKHRIRPDGTLENKRKATPYEELAYLKKLMAQVDQHNLVEESQLDFAKDRGYVYAQFYLYSRANIQGFEKMKIKDILQKLIERQTKVIAARKAEGLLGSDQESLK